MKGMNHSKGYLKTKRTYTRVFNNEDKHDRGITCLMVKLEFAGGLEIITETSKASYDFDGEDCSIVQVIDYVTNSVIKKRSDMFAEGGIIRNGILVLINDTDWDLENNYSARVKPSDTVCFISTLHGG